MLFRREQHDKIASGEITRTVRVWRAAKVKPGNRYKVWTIGLVEVDAVAALKLGELVDEDARLSGYADLAALHRELVRTARRELAPDGVVFRVDFHFAGAAERATLDLDDTLDAAEVAVLARKLDRMDASAAAGPWTRATLALIADNPGLGSKVLAVRLGRERMALKADVRKLKRLGLTQSLEVGYQISPRGRAWLAANA